MAPRDEIKIRRKTPRIYTVSALVETLIRHVEDSVFRNCSHFLPSWGARGRGHEQGSRDLLLLAGRGARIRPRRCRLISGVILEETRELHGGR